MDINYTGRLAVSLYGILIQGCRHNGNPRHTETPDCSPAPAVGAARGGGGELGGSRGERAEEKETTARAGAIDRRKARARKVGNADFASLAGLVRSVFAALSTRRGRRRYYCFVLRVARAFESRLAKRGDALRSGGPVNNRETVARRVPSLPPRSLFLSLPRPGRRCDARESTSGIHVGIHRPADYASRRRARPRNDFTERLREQRAR